MMTEVQQRKVDELVALLREHHGDKVGQIEGDIWLSTELNKAAKVFPDGSYWLIWPRSYSRIPISYSPDFDPEERI